MKREIHKPTLPYLCTFHSIDTLSLASASNLSLPTVLAILGGYAMTPETAEAVLLGINTLKGTQYTLADVQVDLVEGCKVASTSLSEETGDEQP